MPGEINLAGDWAGEYRQYDQHYPIQATFAQEGTILNGSMIDDEPEHELPLAEVARFPGEDERVVAMLRSILPDGPTGPIFVISRVPKDSTLTGTINGNWVYFDKSYQGSCFGGFRVGDEVVGDAYENHVVHYSGRLTPDGGEIEGRWWISANPGAVERLEGSFLLRRKASGPES
ncbi:hypothetical protein [Singulisphaera sp. PoT]|uniref:hypothetical protein n=1 Tax=Singulisphaera sp. PoT TaxID=3411797 RepID=UPI003BF53CB7